VTTPVSHVWAVRIKKDGPALLALHGPGLESGWVAIRGDFIEVQQGPVARRLTGTDYRFCAREAWLSVAPAAFGREWLVITGTSDGQPAFVSVSPGSRVRLEQMWHALVAAGARPER